MKLYLLIALFATSLFATTQAFSQEHEIPLTESEGGTFYLNSEIVGVSSSMLFDTGSKYVVLGKDTFAIVKMTSQVKPLRTIHAIMANGRGAYYPVYQIDKISFSADCEFYNVEVVVMQGSTKDILGLNVIKEMTPLVLYVYPDPFITTQECGRDLTQDRDVNYIRTNPLRTNGKHNHE